MTTLLGDRLLQLSRFPVPCSVCGRSTDADDQGLGLCLGCFLVAEVYGRGVRTVVERN